MNPVRRYAPLVASLSLLGAWLFFFSAPADAAAYARFIIFFLFGGAISFIGSSLLRGAPRLDPEILDPERKLDQIFNEAPTTFSLMVGRDHVYAKANKKFFEFSGYPASVIGKPIREVYHGANAEKIFQMLDQVYETGQRMELKEIHLTLPEKTGGRRNLYVDQTYQALRDSGGKVYGIVCQNFDVTDRVVAKRAIENERENVLNLFRQTPEMVCYLKGSEHRFEFVNEAHIQILGFDATGRTVREAQPESVEVYDILDEVYRSGKTISLHEAPVTVTDRLRYFNLTYAARRDEEGVVNGVMILGTEVTAQVSARSLLQREARLIEMMPSPFFAMNASWEVVYWNPASVEVIGLKKEEVLGRVLWDIFPDLEDSEFGKMYKQARDEGKILSFETYYPHYKRWYRAWPFPFDDGVAVTFLDVTDRKLIQEELEKSRERYHLLFDSSPLPKIIFDAETLKIIDVNETAIKHYGYSREEFLQRTKADLRPLEDVAQLRESLTHQSQTEVEVHTGLRHVKKNGSIMNVEISALDLTLNGRRARFCAIVDVTEKVRAQEQQQRLMENLQEAKAEAERANALKSAFLANMSHEIRTPLGAMIGFADLLRDPGISHEEHASFINIVTRNGEQLSTIINDILDLSKVEAGHLTLEYSETSPDSIVADVISLLRVKANEKDIALEFTAEDSTPELFVTDPLRVRQILLNIIGNAIKFTQAGSVKVRSFGQRSDAGAVILSYEVTDTGIGIPPSQAARIFKAFVQGDGALNRKYGGTGLGLALSRELARELGGELTLSQSVEGRGSTFLISITDSPSPSPTTESKRSREESKITVAPNALEKVRVLVVDDSPDNRKLLWHFLSKYGAAVDFAENGLLGYRKALAGNFDVVLMDIQMPEMDGYAATQKLRDAGYQKPIIALTAHAMDEVRKKCLGVGCTDHLTKPIKPKELVEAVARYARL